MRYVLSFLAVALVTGSGGHAEAPGSRPKARSAYLCQALIMNASSEYPLREANSYQARFAYLVKRAMTQFSLERRYALGTTLARVRADVLNLGPNHYAVKQELVGATAIRAYLKRVTRDATRLEAEHDAARAREPFTIKPYLLKDLAATLTATTITGVWGYLTSELMHTGHPAWASLTGVMALQTVWTSLVPFVTNVVRDVRNVLTLRAHARGRELPRRASTADLVDQKFSEFAADVVKALSGPKVSEANPVWATSRVFLPLSRSTTTYWLQRREVPGADEIGAAVRRSGDFVLPFDPRVLDVDHAFFFDPAINEPVLITLVRERAQY